MKVSVTYQRPDEWVRSKRIEMGDNVPYYGSVECELTELAESTRRLLLAAGDGNYLDEYDGIYADAEGRVLPRPGWRSTPWAHERFICASMDPSVQEIDVMISTAYGRAILESQRLIIERAKKAEAGECR